MKHLIGIFVGFFFFGSIYENNTVINDEQHDQRYLMFDFVIRQLEINCPSLINIGADFHCAISEK